MASVETLQELIREASKAVAIPAGPNIVTTVTGAPIDLTPEKMVEFESIMEMIRKVFEERYG